MESDPYIEVGTPYRPPYISVAVQALPPFVVYKKKIPEGFREGEVPGTQYCVSDSGWSNSFALCLKVVF